MKPKSEWEKVVFITITIVIFILTIIGIKFFTRNARLAKSNMKQAQSEYQRAEYDRALSHYMLALQYDDTLVEAYQKIADVFLKKGSYKEALRILAEGIEKTQNAALSERADYLNEHIIMTKWTCSKDRKLIAEASFDPSGNLTKIITYKDGNIASQNEYTYDTAGNQTRSIIIDYNSDGDMEKITESKWGYDAAGAIAAYEYEAEAYFNAGSIGSCRGEAYSKAGRKNKWVYYGGEENVIVEWYEDEYDIDGNHVKETDYNKDGEIIKVLEYEYNENGEVTKSISYNGDGEVNYWYETEYDGAGNFIRCIYHNGDLSAVYEECVYDASGNKLKYTRYDWNGELEEQAEWEYNGAGNQTKYRYYDKTGKLENWSEIEYDEDGNKISYIRYNSDGSIEERSDWVYDESGNEIESIYSVRGSIAYWRKYAYNKTGNVIRESSYYEHNRKREEWVYDESGNKIEYISSRDGTFERREVYAYDKAGNVISKITYNGAESISQKEEWTYDADGNQLKYLKYDEMLSLTEQKLWEYNEDGTRLISVGLEKTKDGENCTTWIKYKDGCTMQKLIFYDFECTEQEYLDAISGNTYDEDSRYTFVCEYCLTDK